VSAAKFWGPFEREVKSYTELSEAIDEIFDGGSARTFAWRGQVEAAWALHSSLYRRLYWTKSAHPPKEAELYKVEGEILADVHRWGLHMPVGLGRLSILDQLAVLQHYGAPTRLIDVTFNSWIGVWFAVEKKEDRYETCDGRLFAIDVTDRLINENAAQRDWEDEIWRFWGRDEDDGKVKNPIDKRTWSTTTFAWRPPHFDRRIAAQNGGFIFGGVPTSNVRWPMEPSRPGTWRIEDVRNSTAVALRPHLLGPNAVGRPATHPVYTIRIKAAAKKSIRARLERLYGYHHRTIYPDFSGFAACGTPGLRTAPP
jgi:hypothetical protein